MQKRVEADSRTSKTIEVAFNELRPGTRVNARHASERQIGIDELAALIKAKGLLQPLIVRPMGTALYEVTAGNRRLAAIGQLIKAKDWDGPVPVIVRKEGDRDARETSLIENIGRLPMHPVDQHEVFADLHAKGAAEAEIAARYGVSEQVVRQRLALGNLAPEARAAWREGRLEAGVAKLLARLPQRKQAAIIKASAGDRIDDWEVRRELKDQGSVRLSDPRVRFVGLEAYTAAGGKHVPDLFPGDGRIDNPELLEELVAKRLESMCAELVAAGWAWAVPEAQARQHWQWPRLEAKGSPTPAEKKRLDALRLRLQALEEEDDDESGVIVGEIDAIEDAVKARAFGPKQRARSGCVIKVSEHGLDITYGLMRPKDGPAQSPAQANGRAAPDAAAPRAGGADGMSNALLQDLTERQTRAAGAAVARLANSQTLLRLALAGMEASYGAPVRLRVDGWEQLRGKVNGAKFETALERTEGLDAAALFSRLAALLSGAIDLRSFCGSSMRSPTATPSTAAFIALLPAAEYLEAMSAAFDPEDYFKRSPARVAVEAIAEMTQGRITAHASIGKKALVSSATLRAKETGWLPPLLRHPSTTPAGPRKAKRRTAAA